MVTIPSPAKVFTLTGAFAGPIKASWLKSELWRAPNERIHLSYPNFPSNANALAGANTINTVLHTWTPSTHVIIYGHSMGAEVIYKWLREFGPTSDIPTNKVTFVSSGNPERKYTGASVVRPSSYPAVYPGTGGYGVGYGLPSSPTPYKVIDIAKQYDFWADHPSSTVNRNAILNIGSFLSCPMHRDYTDVGLNDPKNVVSTEGNVTYITAPVYPLKILRLSKWRGKEYVMRRDQELRPGIEAAYTRPKPVPLPDYWGEKSGETRQNRTVTCTPGRPTFWAKIK